MIRRTREILYSLGGIGLLAFVGYMGNQENQSVSHAALQLLNNSANIAHAQEGTIPQVTDTPTPTPTETPTTIPTDTPTTQPSDTPTEIPTNTDTPEPATSTATATPEPATPTFTATPVEGATNTPTPDGPTATFTATFTPDPEGPTPTVTLAPGVTFTPTPRPPTFTPDPLGPTPTDTPIPTDTPLPPSRTDLITLTVYDAEDNPLAGIPVYGRRNPTLIVDTETNANGQFDVASYLPETTELELGTKGENDGVRVEYNFQTTQPEYGNAIIFNESPALSTALIMSFTMPSEITPTVSVATSPNMQLEFAGEVNASANMMALENKSDGTRVELTDLEGNTSSVQMRPAAPEVTAAGENSIAANETDVTIFTSGDVDGFEFTITKADGTTAKAKVAPETFTSGSVAISTADIGKQGEANIPVRIDTGSGSVIKTELPLEGGDNPEETEEIFLPFVTR